jgi:pyruvate dehydrogenase E1 component beta subunit
VEASLKAAREIAEGGLDAEVLDLRTLKPMDDEAILTSVRKTGRCLIFEEGPLIGGIGAEIAARIGERAFSSLKAPVLRVAAQDTPIPAAINLERAIIPSAEEIVRAIDRLFG